MAVTFDAAAKSIQTSTASNSIALTIAANAFLLVSVSTVTNPGGSVSSVAANGNALTQIARVEASAGVILTIFCITAAPSGSVSISANLVGGTAFTMQIQAASYLGVRSALPIGTINTGTAGAVNNINISLSTSTTDRVVFFAAGINDITAMNATTRLNTNTNFGSFWADTAGSSTAISLSASAIVTSQNIAFLGINLAFTSSGAATSPWGLASMGCGT